MVVGSCLCRSAQSMTRAAKCFRLGPMFAQDPHRVGPAEGRLLEEAIGREVRNFREKLGLTIAELAKSSRISAGMTKSDSQALTIAFRYADTV